MTNLERVSVDMTGKVCLVTGANTGIGKVTALELARAGAKVVLACRHPGRAQAAIDDITRAVPGAQLVFLQLDLASLDSVREAAQAFIALQLPLHVLINNAGLAGHRGTTTDGFERAFGVNHLGHFLFTQLLLEKLGEQPGGRVVIVASKAHYGAKKLDFQILRQSTASSTGFPEYEVSKLCNVLHGSELARRLRAQGSDITVCSLHPGVIASDIWRRVPWPVRALMKLFMVSNEEGAVTTLWCATTPDGVESGRYYDKCKPRTTSALARDKALAEDLWQRSVAWVGL